MMTETNETTEQAASDGKDTDPVGAPGTAPTPTEAPQAQEGGEAVSDAPAAAGTPADPAPEAGD